jgi:hypothetical protein
LYPSFEAVKVRLPLNIPCPAMMTYSPIGGTRRPLFASCSENHRRSTQHLQLF